MTKCNYCGLEASEPKGYIRKFCDACVPCKEIGVPRFVQKVFVSKEYGYESKARMDEVKRRVMLPMDRTDGQGDYYVGRIGENGKIQEKMGDIRP